MSICTEPSYKCDSYGTKKITTRSETTQTYKQIASRVFTLKYGDKSLGINKRTRNYSYIHKEVTAKAGSVKWITDSEGAQTECSNYSATTTGTINEDYTTTDITIQYVDLRNDLIVYTEVTQTLKFSGDNSGGAITNMDGSHPGADSYGHTGNLVYMKPYSVPLVPFVFESVPITTVTKIVCTAFDEPLFEETTHGGYWNGVRVLMPAFTDGSPFERPFNFGGTTYSNAADVDWYYLPNHVSADGDMFFWWADWHKSVGVNNELDATAATKINDFGIAAENDNFLNSGNGVAIKDFMGSAVLDKDKNIFLSAALDVVSGQVVLVSKLIVDGQKVEIPKEQIRDRVMDGGKQKMGKDGNPVWTDPKDSEYDLWYPIAPI